MNINFVLPLLEKIKKDDETFEVEKIKTTAATLCNACHANKPIALVPFWHRFGRRLCEDCGKDYIKFLKDLGATFNER